MSAETWVLDLDGVVWLADVPIAGSAAAVARLRATGRRVVFVTNNSAGRVADHLAKLGRAGIDAAGDELVTSATAAAQLVAPGSTAVVVGGAGVHEALERRGVTVVDRGPADAVVVGWDRAFDYDRLTEAATAVLGGARLIGTNDDPTYPTPDGPVPGAGAILAAVATAAGVTPDVAGKPHDALVDLLAGQGPVAVVVGDRPSTDGLLAHRLGARFALVLSGVTSTADVVPRPDLVGDSLATLVASVVEDP